MVEPSHDDGRQKPYTHSPLLDLPVTTRRHESACFRTLERNTPVISLSYRRIHFQKNVRPNSPCRPPRLTALVVQIASCPTMATVACRVDDAVLKRETIERCPRDNFIFVTITILQLIWTIEREGIVKSVLMHTIC